LEEEGEGGGVVRAVWRGGPRMVYGRGLLCWEVACGVGFVDLGRCAERGGKEEANETCLFGCESWYVIENCAVKGYGVMLVLAPERNTMG